MTATESTQSVQRDWVALESTYMQGTFKRQPVTFVRGKGSRVWDTEGKVYLDFVAGIAVNILGHCHPAVVQAIQKQATELIHVSNLYYNTRQIELAEILSELSQGMRSFFSNSGAEANEGAMKLARKYGRLHRNGAYEIISMDGSFHGRTLATTAATGQAMYQASWAPLPDGFKQVPFNDVAAVKAATSAKTAGILIEAVQGEGGIWRATREFMQGIRQWCDEQNLVMICDEVQCGMGRTGKFFGWEHYDAKPDIITLAKGLAGGMPIAAMLTGSRTDLFMPGEHGTTIGGNPLSCAAAIVTINTLLAENLIAKSLLMGAHWQSKLEILCHTYDFIDSPRGIGMMQAVHVKNGLAPAIVQKALEHGLLINSPDPETIRMVPPLIVTIQDIEEAAERLDKTLADVAKQQ